MFDLPLPAACLTVGVTAALLAWGLTRRGFRSIERPVKSWDWTAAVTAGLLSALLAVALRSWDVQVTHEVRPTAFWGDFRVISQAILIVLLVAATCTDLDGYYIPDVVTYPGMIIGLLLAAGSGDLQIAHVWVDWNEAIPQIRGPYIPAWLSAHPHWHGLAWSAAGLVTGGVLTWGVRTIASRLMGMEALGFGDVTLMAMVGSFLGWQPTVIAFLLAPLCALLIGVVQRLLGGKSYIPYGPYLALASLIVMFTWHWIWMFEYRLHAAAGPNDREGIFAVRRFFGDPVSLGILVGIMVVGLVFLLGLGRLYRMIPGRREGNNAV